MSPEAGDPLRPDVRVARLLGVLRSVALASSLEEVVNSVVESAAECCGARGAAVAVFGQEQPVAGVETIASCGTDAPDGPQARIERLEALHAAGVATRSGTGPIAFLGVPVDVDGRVVGGLYVAGRDEGAFGDEDLQVLESLAGAVATAVRAAHLRADFRTQQRWLTATAEIGAQLLTHTGEDPLRLIARRASELSDADLVVVSLVTDDESHIVIEAADGPGAPDILGQRFPVRETMSGLAVVERRPILANPGSPERRGFGGHGSNLQTVIDIGPLMVLPLIGVERVRGSMSVSRVQGRAPFTQTDLTLAAGYATHASVALELADSRVAEQRVVLLEDRDRIARDLHDHVIQELFAIGLSLQSIATQIGLDSEPGTRIGQRVEDLDRTIRRIRTSIFELRGPLGGVQGDGLRHAALEIAADLTPALGFAPHVGFSGPVDLAVDAELTADITAVLREALTNVAKHAHATRVTLDIDLLPSEVVVTVCDDGVGIGNATRSSGITNLRARAERHHGSFDVTVAATGGTLLIWRSPVP